VLTNHEPAAGAPPSSSPAQRATVVALAIALLAAAYAGFRVPNAWCATLDAVSLFDGFHHRFAVGTLLRPLAVASHYNYWLFAAFGFAVLAGVLAVLVSVAVRTPLVARRVLVIAWLLLPSGGFVFHEVGYFEQLLYLLLFAALWLLARGRVACASAVLCLAPCVHELAAVSVLPVFGLAVLHALPIRRAIGALVAPALVGLCILALPPAGPGAVAQLSAALAQANFPYRPDALALFERSLPQSWAEYSVQNIFIIVRPVAILLVGAFLALWRCAAPVWPHRPGHAPAPLLVAASCVAIAAPALLVLGGYDSNRWIFLICANFFLAVWLALGDRPRPLGGAAVIAFATTLLVLSQLPIDYFDELHPRHLGSRADRKALIHGVATGALFARPARW